MGFGPGCYNPHWGAPLYVTGSGKISNIAQKFKIELSILRYRSKPKEQNDISLEAITYLETAL